jgi:transposase
MTSKAAELVAGIIDRIEGRPYRTGRPPLPTITVVETLRFFVREGVQWRELRAAAGRACGATLRRRLDEWSGTALLRRVHAALVRTRRAGPEVAPWDVVVDSCSVRAKRGGELIGPNPTDRGKAGTKYHIVTSTDGIPLGVVPSAANVHSLPSGPRSWTGGTRASSRTCYAWPWPSAPRSAGSTPMRPEPAVRPAKPDRGDSADNRGLCAREGIQPLIREVGQPHGSGLGTVRCIVEHDCAWLLANKRLDRRHDRLGRMILALLTAACIFVIANRLSPF